MMSQIYMIKKIFNQMMKKMPHKLVFLLNNKFFMRVQQGYLLKIPFPQMTFNPNLQETVNME